MNGILKKQYDNWIIIYQENVNGKTIESKIDVESTDAIHLPLDWHNSIVDFKVNLHIVGSGDYAETIRYAKINSFVESNYTIHPDYYNSTNITPLDIIDDWNLDFRLGNVIKYIARAGKKNSETEILDLEKALSYLKGKINHLKNKDGKDI